MTAIHHQTPPNQGTMKRTKPFSHILIICLVMLMASCNNQDGETARPAAKPLDTITAESPAQIRFSIPCKDLGSEGCQESLVVAVRGNQVAAGRRGDSNIKVYALDGRLIHNLQLPQSGLGKMDPTADGFLISDVKEEFLWTMEPDSFSIMEYAFNSPEAYWQLLGFEDILDMRPMAVHYFQEFAVDSFTRFDRVYSFFHDSSSAKYQQVLPGMVIERDSLGKIIPEKPLFNTIFDPITSRILFWSEKKGFALVLNEYLGSLYKVELATGTEHLLLSMRKNEDLRSGATFDSSAMEYWYALRDSGFYRFHSQSIRNW